MADGFEAMVRAAQDFFPKLAENNNKAWFEPHKAFYTDEIKKPAELFAGLIAEDLVRLTGQPHTSKVFRIYRDVRFSKDKTPLNTHLHISWSPSEGPTWFWGLSPDYFIMGLGFMGFDAPALTAFRAKIDKDGDALAQAIDACPRAAVSDFGPAPLKRVPKPYDQDHPHADWLKRKAFTVTVPMSESWAEAGLVKSVNASIKDMLPIWKILSR